VGRGGERGCEMKRACWRMRDVDEEALSGGRRKEVKGGGIHPAALGAHSLGVGSLERRRETDYFRAWTMQLLSILFTHGDASRTDTRHGRTPAMEPVCSVQFDCSSFHPCAGVRSARARFSWGPRNVNARCLCVLLSLGWRTLALLRGGRTACYDYLPTGPRAALRLSLLRRPTSHVSAIILGKSLYLLGS
jgi:hypothetical protein